MQEGKTANPCPNVRLSGGPTALTALAFGVSLGPGHLTWTKLYEALAGLAKASGGSFAFVLDEGNGLWCVGIPDWPPTSSTRAQDHAADRFYAREIVPRIHSMRRGVRFELAQEDGEDRYVACSFASIYVVVVWFDGPMQPLLVRARIHRAIPEIEQLTLSLPPTDPGANESSAKLRA